MSPDKTRRTVLVTGANRGIGLEIARQLAAQRSTSSSARHRFLRRVLPLAETAGESADPPAKN